MVAQPDQVVSQCAQAIRRGSLETSKQTTAARSIGGHQAPCLFLIASDLASPLDLVPLYLLVTRIGQIPVFALQIEITEVACHQEAKEKIVIFFTPTPILV
jgi:hypothetical protein